MAAQIIDTRPDEGTVHFHGLGIEIACTVVHTGQLWKRVAEQRHWPLAIRDRIWLDVNMRTERNRGPRIIGNIRSIRYQNEHCGIIRAGVRVR